MSNAIAAAGVFMLAVLAPFELSAPLLRLPGQSLSNLEAALFVAGAAWGVAAIASRRRRIRSMPLAGPWVAFVAAMAVAAAAAGAQRANAAHMVGRFMAAGGVYLLAVQGLTTVERLRTAVTAAVAAGVVVAVLVVLEYLQVGAVLNLLRWFRPAVTAVGAQVRAGGPLQYPTIASMYLEVVFAFGVGLMFAALDNRQRNVTALWFVALVTIGEAITLTFTRAGLITMGLSLAGAAAWRWRQRGPDRATAMVAALAMAISVMFLVSRPAQSLWLRMTSEGQDSWYRAQLDGPSQLSFETNKLRYVPVRATNRGRLAWDSSEAPPMLLSYHWLDANADRVVAWEGERTVFPAPVTPGTAADVYALVRGPREPGHYRLEWDIVQEGRLWFSTEQDAPDPMTSAATVTGSGTGAPIRTTARPARTVRPGRMVLWRTAARMVASHPLLGVGPDNFRLLYGSYAGLAGADPRTHTNNMYLEVLVGGGIVAFACFLVLVGRSASLFVTALKTQRNLGIGVAAAGMAIAVHALVDSFLSFAPTYIVFALTLGFAAAAVRSMEIPADAHRV